MKNQIKYLKAGLMMVALLMIGVGACQPTNDTNDSATNTRPLEQVESPPMSPEMDTTDMAIDTVSTDSVPG